MQLWVRLWEVMPFLGDGVDGRSHSGSDSYDQTFISG